MHILNNFFIDWFSLLSKLYINPHCRIKKIIRHFLLGFRDSMKLEFLFSKKIYLFLLEHKNMKDLNQKWKLCRINPTR